MRLIELNISAIGPFAGDVSINLELLGGGGLFLLEGPTGSGKSTVIDAITFALYGTTAGTSSLDRLHSRAAAASAVPTVDLVFEVPEGRYRVCRSPAHERSKLRGHGTTTSPASAKLWDESEPDPKLRTARAREVDAELQRLIGLTRDQFVQTVVLPQGEFSRFLCSKPGDRAEVLKRLFATETYDALADELHRRKQTAVRERDRAWGAVTAKAAAFATSARLPGAENAACQAAEPDHLLALTVAAIGEISDHVALSERGLKALEQSWRDCDRELTEVQRIQRAYRRYAEAMGQLRQLESRRDEYAEWTRQAEVLIKVSTLGPLYDRLLVARADAEQAQADWQGVAVPTDLPPDITEAELNDLVEAELNHRAFLAQYAKIEIELQRAQEATESDRLLEADLDRRVTTHRGALESTRALRMDLTERQQSLELRARDLDRLREELNRTEARQSAAIELERLRAEWDSRRVELATAHQSASTAEQHVTRLRSAYLDEMASQLALELVDGNACPVCGSEDHPHPAPAPRISVSREELDAAETASSAAFEELRQADDLARQLEGRIADAAVACGGVAVETSEAELAAALVSLQRATEDVGELGHVRGKLGQMADEVDELEKNLSVDQAELVAIRAQIRVSEERLTTTVSELEPHRGSFATVGEYLTDVERRYRTLKVARDVLRAREKAELSLTRAEEDLGTAIRREGFASEEAVAQLIDRLDELPGLRQSMRSHEDGIASARAILSDPEVARVAGLDPPDTAEAEKRARLARGLHDGAFALNERWRERMKEARFAAVEVRKAVAAFRKVEQRTSDVIRLAEVLAGSSQANRLDMPLATYVLVDRFRAVVAAANERLQTMSDGRYMLEHHGEREDRARLAGLGLWIRDLQTDSIRGPRTLSGGETFYASLSLALGLADVVTAEAGGRSLGTLFIDEGFGGLDPDTLDQVMVEIERLRTADRVVGIVSHVAGLKDRIPNRMEIRRLGQGRSDVLVHVAG